MRRRSLGCFARADELIEKGANILVLSDRGFDAENAPIPALLAISGLHHHLIRNGNRMRAALVVESGEPRETHHMALLIGYGASAVAPYMAYETLNGMIHQNMLVDMSYEEAVSGYVKSLVKGIVKIMSKIGISTVQSYHGAQIFEALGLNTEFVGKYFTWTASRIQGVGIDVIAEESVKRHSRAYAERDVETATLETGGFTDGDPTESAICTIRAPCTSCRKPARREATRNSRSTRSLQTTRKKSILRFAA